MGMLYGMAGMIALIIIFWVDNAYTYDDGPWLIAASMGPGMVVGLASAYWVAMTGLPQMVGLYNGFGGLAAAMEALGMYLDPENRWIVRDGNEVAKQTSEMLWIQGISLILSIVIGMMTFTGSLVAFGKLNGNIASKPRVVPFRGIFTALMFSAMTIFGALTFSADPVWGGADWNGRHFGLGCLITVICLAAIEGFAAVMAIGGGDMPVSISFLNSLSGFSTSAAGFMMSNKALVISGAFVGCSGTILTLVMCENMNRSVKNVLLGGFGAGSAPKSSSPKGGDNDEEEQGEIKEVSSEDVVEMLTGAKKVVIAPGYGMVCTFWCTD